MDEAHEPEARDEKAYWRVEFDPVSRQSWALLLHSRHHFNTASCEAAWQHGTGYKALAEMPRDGGTDWMHRGACQRASTVT